MKEVRGIKALSISALFTNGAILAMTLSTWYGYGGKASTNDLVIFVFVIAAFVIYLLYPTQLLFMRKRYYRGIPISSGARTFLHILRSLQAMIIIGLATFFTWAAYTLIVNLRYRFNPNFRYFLPTGILLLVLASVVLNTMIFLKGWRFLKLVRTTYIDEVMATFD